MRTPTASPSKLPGHYWAYFFYSVVLGVPLGAVIAFATLARAAPLGELANLPVAREARATPAAFAGALVGPGGRVTPAGRSASLWASWVTVARRSGKSTVTSTVCARRASDGLSLALAGESVAVDPSLFAGADFAGDLDAWSLSSRAYPRPMVQTAGTSVTGAVPPGVLAGCSDAPSNRGEGTWRYHEAWVAPGAPVEIAGCVRAGRLGACASGVAAGHLASPHSVRALARSVATRTMVTAGLLALLVSFFALVSLVGALVALRDSARRGPR